MEDVMYLRCLLEQERIIKQIMTAAMIVFYVEIALILRYLTGLINDK